MKRWNNTLNKLDNHSVEFKRLLRKYTELDSHFRHDVNGVSCTVEEKPDVGEFVKFMVYRSAVDLKPLNPTTS
jgi:hypothetical protein